MFNALPSMLGHVKERKLRALGVSSAKRSPEVPDVPAIQEVVPGYVVTTWYSLVAPKGTPKEVVDKLNREVNAAMADPKINARLTTDLGGTVLSFSPAEFAKFIADEAEKWGKVVKAANMKVE
jgi:tripartite-type tricarboxylate transporter receptor subunit TctC